MSELYNKNEVFGVHYSGVFQYDDATKSGKLKELTEDDKREMQAFFNAMLPKLGPDDDDILEFRQLLRDMWKLGYRPSFDYSIGFPSKGVVDYDVRRLLEYAETLFSKLPKNEQERIRQDRIRKKAETKLAELSLDDPYVMQCLNAVRSMVENAVKGESLGREDLEREQEMENWEWGSDKDVHIPVKRPDGAKSMAPIRIKGSSQGTKERRSGKVKKGNTGGEFEAVGGAISALSANPNLVQDLEKMQRGKKGGFFRKLFG